MEPKIGTSRKRRGKPLLNGGTPQASKQSARLHHHHYQSIVELNTCGADCSDSSLAQLKKLVGVTNNRTTIARTKVKPVLTLEYQKKYKWSI